MLVEAPMGGCRRILRDTRMPAQMVGDAPMFDLCFTQAEVVGYRSALGDPVQQKRYKMP